MKRYNVTVGGVTKLVTVEDSETSGEYVVTLEGDTYITTATEVPEPEPSPEPETDPDSGIDTP